MRNGTPVFIVIPNKWRSSDAEPDFIKVPGVVVSDPMPSQYINRNTGSIIQSALVEVVSLRDTTKTNPAGGRRWHQQTSEPQNLLVRRFGDPIVGLDTDSTGVPLSPPALFELVETSIIDFRRRQLLARAKPVAAGAPA